MRDCPSPQALEAAWNAGDLAVQAHARRCPHCGPTWQAWGALRSAAQALPAPALSAAEHATIRSALLAAPASPTSTAKARWGWLAAAAIVMLGVGLWMGRTQTQSDRRRAQVVGQTNARYTHGRAGSDEYVRLVEGQITVSVPPLGFDRLRVLVGDDEVEVRGTLFDVVARADRLQTVRVHHGRVIVRVAGATVADLTAGQRWRRAEASMSTPSPAVQMAKRFEGDRSAMTTPTQLAPQAHRAPRVRPATRAPAGRARPDPAPIAPPSAAPPSAVSPEPIKPLTEAPEVAWRAAWQTWRRGDAQAAADRFARFLRVHPTHPLAQDAAWWLGEAWAKAGRPDRARAAWRRFLARFPHALRRGAAQMRLGEAALARQDRAAAIRWFDAARQDDAMRTAAEQHLRALRLETNRQSK